MPSISSEPELCLIMAALTACIRQVGNGALQRCAASAWNHISQPLAQLHDFRDSELHNSEPGVFMSAADATRSSPESRTETKLSMPDFMWMGKGDKRTFRGKLKRGSYGKMRPRKLKDPLKRKAWWHQEPSESSSPLTPATDRLIDPRRGNLPWNVM